MKNRLMLLNIIVCLFLQIQFATAQDKQMWREHYFYKDAQTQRFKIIDETGKTRYQNLKFVGYASSSLQVLDENNKIFFLDDKLRIVSPRYESLEVCGTVNDYREEIIFEYPNFWIQRKTYPFGGENFTSECIDFFPKENIKDIYFLYSNNKKLNYDDNFPIPSTLVVIMKNNQLGLKEIGEEIQFYDEIKLSEGGFCKVRRGKLWGFYNITDLKYKKLGDYDYNLAPFELEDGTKGFVDLRGNEYY